jgi:hypothetical protein
VIEIRGTGRVAFAGSLLLIAGTLNVVYIVAFGEDERELAT